MRSCFAAIKRKLRIRIQRIRRFEFGFNEFDSTRPTISEMRVFSCFMLISVFAFLGLNASPIISQRAGTSYYPSGLEQQPSSDFAEHYSKDNPEPTVKQDTVFQHSKLPSDNLMANPFYLFAAYDKRGPWKLTFLPQPPPTPRKWLSKSCYQTWDWNSRKLMTRQSGFVYKRCIEMNIEGVFIHISTLHKNWFGTFNIPNWFRNRKQMRQLGVF